MTRKICLCSIQYPTQIIDGVPYCTQCMHSKSGQHIKGEAKMSDNKTSFSSPDEGVDFIQQAKDAVIAYNNGGPDYVSSYAEAQDAGDAAKGISWLSQDEVYVVWFCYILGGWKALVSTARANGLYYEVTFNKEKQELYLDVYQKEDNIVVPWVGKGDPARIPVTNREISEKISKARYYREAGLNNREIGQRMGVTENRVRILLSGLPEAASLKHIDLPAAQDFANQHRPDAS